MLFNNMQYCFGVLRQLSIFLNTVGDFSAVGFGFALDNFNC